jgi:hypothetical protein
MLKTTENHQITSGFPSHRKYQTAAVGTCEMKSTADVLNAVSKSFIYMQVFGENIL